MFSGILSITPSATAGTATVSAECDEIKKSINLVLNSLGNANKVEFYSDEVVYRGTSKYMQLQSLTVWLLLLVIQNGRYSIIQKECQMTVHLLFLTAQTTILQL